MKRNLAMILTLALVLSLTAVGLAFTASADSAEATDWVAYSEAKWAATVADGAVASSVLIRYNDGSRHSVKTLAPGDSIDFSQDNGGYPYTAGSMAYGTDGVLTISGMVRKPDTDGVFAEVIAYGGVKVVLDGEFCGSIRNDEESSTGKSGGLFITGSSNGGHLTSNLGAVAIEDYYRSGDGLYIYGDIGFDVYARMKIQYSNGEAILAPKQDSTINTNGLAFLVKCTSGKYYSKIVFAGGAKISVNDFANNQSPTDFPGDCPLTEFVVDGARLVWSAEFAECTGDNFDLIPAISLKNNAVFEVATVFPGSLDTVKAKTTCDDGSVLYVNGELVKGTLPSTDTGSSDTSSSTDNGGTTDNSGTTDASGTTDTSGTTDNAGSSNTDTNTDTNTAPTVDLAKDYATQYAEGVWKKISKDDYAMVKLRCGATYMTFADGKDYITDGAVDFATANFGNIVGGTMTVKDGVVTLDGIIYKEGATTSNVNLIFDSGAGKLVIKNCVWLGDVRSDWTTKNKTESTVLVTSDGTGAIKFSGNNSFRTSDSLMIYGLISLDITGDCFWMQNTNYNKETAHDGVLLIAPLLKSSFKVTDTQKKMFVAVDKGRMNVIFAGTAGSQEILIDLAEYDFSTANSKDMSILFKDAKVEIVNGELGKGEVTLEGASNVSVDGLTSTVVSVKDASVLTLKQTADLTKLNVVSTTECYIPLVVKNGSFTAPAKGTYKIDGALKELDQGSVVKCTTAVFVRGVAVENPATSDVAVLSYVTLFLLAGAAAMMVLRKKA